MNLLLVAAMEAEIKPLLEDPSLKGRFSTLITGPGIPATVYGLTRRIPNDKPDLIINAGLAGSFTHRIPTGAVVRITTDCFADLGAEDGEEFLHISEMEFQDEYPSYGKLLLGGEWSYAIPSLLNLPVAKGITVNTVHGNARHIDQVVRRFQPDTESMEGAAVFYVSHRENIPAVQVRAISNKVERRDKSKWETEKAIAKLNEVLVRVIGELAGAE